MTPQSLSASSMASISVALAIARSPFFSAASSPLSNSCGFKRSAAVIPFKCCSDPSQEIESGTGKQVSSLLGISTNSWTAGLGSLGFLETGYLTYLKLTNSEAFCAIGGGRCSDVLNSDYAYVFGIPLSMIGMVAYGFVVLLSLQQTRKNLLSVVGESDIRIILLGITTSMATASAYFLYLLSTTLAGSSCSYCLTSAALSFILFFITLKDFGLDNIQKAVGLQLAIAGVVITALSSSYITVPRSSSSGDITLEPYETEITNQSTTWTISLAEHLHSIGAKMYGAFWCSHCLEQKEVQSLPMMFGREAVKKLDYIECFPDGAGKGRKISKVCTDAGLEGFPTWIIKDKVLSGEQELSDLAEAAGFPLEDYHPS